MEKVWTVAMFFWESGQDNTAGAVGVREPLAAMPWALGQIRTQLSAVDWKAAGIRWKSLLDSTRGTLFCLLLFWLWYWRWNLGPHDPYTY